MFFAQQKHGEQDGNQLKSFLARVLKFVPHTGYIITGSWMNTGKYFF